MTEKDVVLYYYVKIYFLKNSPKYVMFEIFPLKYESFQCMKY